MKKWLAVIVLLLLTAAAVYANDGNNFENPVYSPDYIAEQEQMLNSVETLFPRNILLRTFDGTTKPAISKPANGYYMYTREIYGKREFCIAAINTAPLNRGWGDNFFNTTGSFTDFYMAIDAQIIERDDSRKGYLWIQYTDGNIAGEDGRNAVSIYFPNEIEKYETVGGSRVYTTLYDLSQYAEDYNVHHFEIIRLDGYTRVYIDGHFLTIFEDGFSGRFYQMFGAGLMQGGKYATAQFDNLSIRMKSY